MAFEKLSCCAAIVVIGLLVSPICLAQESRTSHSEEPPQDHSCTVNAAGSFVIPEGNDRQNFDKAGWGFQAGGGFAITRQENPDRGWRWFITSGFVYEKFKANAQALGKAISDNPKLLAGATSAHGAFSAITIDVTPRYAISRRWSVYGLGGFGWLRRSIGFKGANPGTLLQSNGLTLDKLASNSGAFDAAVGINHGLSSKGGLMLFVEGRVYRGLAVNNGSTLVPISVGVRW